MAILDGKHFWSEFGKLNHSAIVRKHLSKGEGIKLSQFCVPGYNFMWTYQPGKHCLKNISPHNTVYYRSVIVQTSRWCAQMRITPVADSKYEVILPFWGFSAEATPFVLGGTKNTLFPAEAAKNIQGDINQALTSPHYWLMWDADRWSGCRGQFISVPWDILLILYLFLWHTLNNHQCVYMYKRIMKIALKEQNATTALWS